MLVSPRPSTYRRFARVFDFHRHTHENCDLARRFSFSENTQIPVISKDTRYSNTMALAEEIYRQLIDEFSKAWSAGSAPEVAEYLQRGRDQLQIGTISSNFVQSLIELDLVQRIVRSSSGSATVERPPRIEDYADYLGEYCGERTIPVSLIAGEFRARLQAGEHPAIEEYQLRFPDYKSIKQLFELDDAFNSDPFATKPPDSRPAPRTFGRYRIDRELGRGGMGVVYQASPIAGGPPVALKTLNQRHAGALTRFKREFRVLSDLTHRNLVKLGELVTTSMDPFFTMELVHGEDFLSYVRSGSDTAAANPHLPFNEQRLRDCLEQLAEGLKALHDEGCIHRDIKPSNVLVNDRGRVVLVDFGLAVDEADQPGEFAGTPYYMAPEQAQGKRVTPAVDAYALGVMLFEALTGKPAFHDHRWDELLAAKLSTERPTPSQLFSSIPEDLSRLCDQLLQVSPESRPNADEILQSLTGAKATPSNAEVWIGRSSQLSRLEAAWKEVQRGATRVVLISGSSGVGKTALVERFIQELRLRDQVVILRGRCYENESVAYQGFDSAVDALVQHLKQVSANQVERILPLELEPLCQIFPALLEVPAVAKNQSSHRAYGNPRERRQQGLAALRELLCRVTRWESLVIFVDDLQWGDDETTELFRELFQAENAPHALFIGTYRSEDADNRCLSRIRVSQQPASDRPLLTEQTEISVDRLEPTEARQLARDLLLHGGFSDFSIAARIAQEAEGDPLFIRVFARQVIESGVTGTDAVQQIGAWTLQDVIWNQVRGLDPISRRVMELLAVAGRPVPIDDLESLASKNESRFGLTRALRAKRLIRHLSDHQQVETYHDKIRESVLTQIPEEQYRSLCLALADHLESRSSELDVEFLADLLRRAGQLTRSGEYYVRAAESASEKLAFELAVQYQRRAIDQLSPAGRLEQEMRTKLGDALANASRAAEAADEYLKAAALADPDQRPPLYQKAALRLLTSGHVDQGIDVLKDALEAFDLPWPRRNWHAIVGLIFRVGRLRFQRLDMTRRRVVSPSPREQECLDVCWAATAGLSVVDPIRGAFYVTESLHRSLRFGNIRFLGRSLAAYIGHAAIGGRRSRREVRRVLLASRDVARVDGDPYSRAFVAMSRGIAALLRGQWRNAQRCCDRAVAFLDDDQCQDIAWELNTARTFALWALQYQGNLRELARRQPDLLRTAEETEDHFAVLNFRTQVMTHLLIAADRPQAALTSLNKDLQLLSNRGFFVQHHNHMLARTYLRLYLGEGQAAFAEIDGTWQKYRAAWLSQVQQVRIDHFQVRTRAALAAAASSPNDRRAMLQAASEGIRRLQRERTPWASALATAFRAARAQLTGDSRTARDLLVEAENASKQGSNAPVCQRGAPPSRQPC